MSTPLSGTCRRKKRLPLPQSCWSSSIAERSRYELNEKIPYGPEDCVRTGYDMFIAGYVAVIKPEALPEHQHGVRQLLFCDGGAGSFPHAADSTVRAVSLSNGECLSKKRNEILGLLKPELIPDRARLQLSQIRPLDSEVPKEPEFFGYCFLPDGRYASGVPLADDLEVREYIDIQSRYQHRLMVCDREDFCVFEMREGRCIFPAREMPDAQQKEQRDADIEIKL
ncbi:hypothetical protein OBV_42870 [Oscillibacter valericigenes Sjm18-20]|nr:hypothetical protein OBV_42870 [Oscillibacter valericigenes Sjm18-20]